MPGEHWSLAGQQEKFALTRLGGEWHEAKGSAATTHIVKPGIKILPHQALIEHVTMRAAAAVGVSTATSVTAMAPLWCSGFHRDPYSRAATPSAWCSARSATRSRGRVVMAMRWGGRGARGQEMNACNL